MNIKLKSNEQRDIRKVLPLTRLKRPEETSVGRVSRDSLPVIRLRKSEGPETAQHHYQVKNFNNLLLQSA